MSDSEIAPATPVDPQPPLDPRTIEQMVQNQSRELDLRAKELELQRQEDNHNFEFSKLSLEAQTQDRKDARRFLHRHRRNAYLFGAFLSTCIFGAIGLSLWLNKEPVALEIIKSIVLLLSGGGTGYAIGRHQSKKSEQSTNQGDPTQ